MLPVKSRRPKVVFRPAQRSAGPHFVRHLPTPPKSIAHEISAQAKALRSVSHQSKDKMDAAQATPPPGNRSAGLKPGILVFSISRRTRQQTTGPTPPKIPKNPPTRLINEN